MIRLFGLLLILLQASPALAQMSIPVHHNIAILSTATGALVLSAGKVRSFLGLYNNSSVKILCALDDTTATATNGLVIAASAGSAVIFQERIPRGALRCFAGSSAELQILEGQ